MTQIAFMLGAAVLVALAVFTILRLAHHRRNSARAEGSASRTAAGEPLDAGTMKNGMPDSGTVIGSLDGPRPSRRVSRPAGVSPLAMHSGDLEQGPYRAGGRSASQPVQDGSSHWSMRRRLVMPLTRGLQPTAKQKDGWHFARENRASIAAITYDLVKAKWPSPLSSADESRIRRYGFRWWPEFGWWILDCSRSRTHSRGRRGNWWEVQGGSPGSGKRS